MTFEMVRFICATWYVVSSFNSHCDTCTHVHISFYRSHICQFVFAEKWDVGKDIPTSRGDFAIGYMGEKVVCAGGLGRCLDLGAHKLNYNGDRLWGVVSFHLMIN